MEFRAFWEFGSVLPAWPVLARAPKGDGHPVVVFPGLSASDSSTAPLRSYLRSLGHDTHGWHQGFNFGPRPGVIERIKTQVRELAQKSGKTVSLVGWSLGGIYAREVAKELPDLVRSATTLGTPFAGTPKSTNAWRLYELVSQRDIEREQDQYELPIAPPVPTTSVYSKTDGIVAWQGSIQRAELGHAQCENVEVLASHVGLGLNPTAWWVVADRLAQKPGNWQAFKRPAMFGLQGWVFPGA